MDSASRADCIRLVKALSYAANQPWHKTVYRTHIVEVREEGIAPQLEAPKVARVGIRKEKGWLYYIDADGDVARTPMRTGKSKAKKTLKRTAKRKAKDVKVTVSKSDPAVQNITVKVESSPEVRTDAEKMSGIKDKISQLEKALTLLEKQGNNEKYTSFKEKIEELKKRLG